VYWYTGRPCASSWGTSVLPGGRKRVWVHRHIVAPGPCLALALHLPRVPLLHGVAPQVCIEKTMRKRFIIFWLISPKPSAVKSGSTWGQLGVNLGSTWGQHRVNQGSTWGQPGVNLGSTWGQPGVQVNFRSTLGQLEVYMRRPTMA